ncbi:MAG: 50S ribosomal protein L25/general stress protein Ctc [Burkholderiaceae bacterium]|nr:50S ribosomal protein L25/general stress protein Ctc [Burkholderiaceae bacterium]
MKVVATSRKVQGSGASRRLRRDGKVPGIVYGAQKSPANIEMDHNPLMLALKVESFHSSILDLEVDGKSEQVLLRDYQMHPYKPLVQHVDFQRVDASQKLQTKVPLHFKNQEISPAVKLSGGMVSHVLTDVLVSCLPKDLPEFIEVDLANLAIGHSLHVRDLVLPAGVTLVLHTGENPTVVTASVPGGAAEEAAPAEGAAPAAEAKPAEK